MTVVAVVAHDPYFARLRVERALILRKASIGAVVEREVRLLSQVLDKEIAFVFRDRRVDLRVGVETDRTARDFPPVDPRMPAARLELVSWDGNHSLDEVLLRVLGESVDDDVSALGWHMRPQA